MAVMPWSDGRDELLKRIAKRSVEWGVPDPETGRVIPLAIVIGRWRIRRGTSTVASSADGGTDDWMIAIDEAFSRLPASDYVVDLGRARDVTGSSTFDVSSLTVSWDPQGISPQLFLTAQYRDLAETSARRAVEAEKDRAELLGMVREVLKANTDMQVKYADSMPAVMSSMRQVNEEVGECITSASRLYMAACQEAAQAKVTQAQNSFWNVVMGALKDDIIQETRLALPTLRGLAEMGLGLGKMLFRKVLPAGGGA